MQTQSFPSLSEAETADLRAVAGVAIPADDGFGVPAADDPTILADILATLGRDTGDVRAALAELSVLAKGPFANLDNDQRDEIATAYLAGSGVPARTLGRVMLQAYYRDDRVVRSLGLEPRPPFPKGHTLEQGDWSLLDPVRARPKLWRDAP